MFLHVSSSGGLLSKLCFAVVNTACVHEFGQDLSCNSPDHIHAHGSRFSFWTHALLESLNVHIITCAAPSGKVAAIIKAMQDRLG